MAVEAGYINCLPSQFLTNRSDLMKPNQAFDTTIHQFDPVLAYNEPMLPASATETNALFQLYQSSMNKADSGLTYINNNNNVPSAPQRKRPRGPYTDLDTAFAASQKPKLSAFSHFIDDDIVFHMQQQESEINRFIAQHTEKVRVELEERRNRQSRMLVSAVQENIINRIKEKDQEIQRMEKLNWALLEKVKSLYAQNQMWKDLAQTNEAEANSLRTNLEQVLTHVNEERHISANDANNNATAVRAADDAESSCGSCGEGYVKPEEVEVDSGDHNDNGKRKRRWCRNCGVRESSVLLLPCRHMCLCTLCGSTLLGTCPVCDSVLNATVHVNMF